MVCDCALTRAPTTTMANPTKIRQWRMKGFVRFIELSGPPNSRVWPPFGPRGWKCNRGAMTATRHIYFALRNLEQAPIALLTRRMEFRHGQGKIAIRLGP